MDRRKFLRNLGIGGAMLAVPAIPLAHKSVEAKKTDIKKITINEDGVLAGQVLVNRGNGKVEWMSFSDLEKELS